MAQVPVRQYVVTIPKMLRLCFKYDRKLLGELSRCFYDSIKEIFLDAPPQAASSPADLQALPAMICSIMLPPSIGCSALDFLAALCTHIPEPGQQLV